MKVYKQKLEMLVPSSPGKDVTYPRWSSFGRLWLDAYTVLKPSPYRIFSDVEATEKEIKLYYTLKKLRNL